jgi:glutamate synthase domain-containing protein 1
MCGIAGIIHRNNTGSVGAEMTSMLQAMKHRGPDSTGFAFYGIPSDDELLLRFKVAEREDLNSGAEIYQAIKERRTEVDRRIESMGGDIQVAETPTEYAFLYRLRFDPELDSLARLADYIEDVEGAEVLSMGRALELIKDLGDATEVSTQYEMGDFVGTHAIGHARMATESDVDICSAHPYWAYPASDVSVVHNGQLTNYWSKRRELERSGHRFLSDCDSELIAVYIAEQTQRGRSLEEAMHQSVEELDGVFSYLVATADALGMAKDTMAAKPMVLYESEDCIAMASEEVAIRTVFPEEIDTLDPYAGEVLVWSTN